MKIIDLTELTKHDLYLAYLDGVKTKQFEGTFIIFQELVRTNRIEVEQ